MGRPYSEGGIRALDDSKEHQDMVSELEKRAAAAADAEARRVAARARALREHSSPSGVMTGTQQDVEATTERILAEQAAAEAAAAAQEPQPPVAA